MTSTPQQLAATRSTLPRPGDQPITARLAGAGSVRQELQALLHAAPAGASRAEYRRLVLEENVAGKASAVSREKSWQRLKDRYVLDPAVREFHTFEAAMRSTISAAEQGLLCLLMMARADRLFRDLTLHCVSPLMSRDGTVIDPQVVHEALTAAVTASGTSWSEDTLQHVRQHTLAALKDFGVLRGGRVKRTARPRPGVPCTLFALQLGRLEGLTDRQLLDAAWFQLLGLDLEGTANLLHAAAGAGALSFRRQAGVVEISLPAEGTA